MSFEASQAVFKKLIWEKCVSGRKSLTFACRRKTECVNSITSIFALTVFIGL